ncbi:hypothetical protein [Sutcliffiella horikoshii]|uniref:hypothetical protein n=1 Tax=Sutcliffiella horikoshii TaxID=79883 RepID=UPI003CF9DF37
MSEQPYVYAHKEVLWYFKYADTVETIYYRLETDHPVRMGWWEIKRVLETFDEKSKELFNLFKQGFLAKEIAIDWGMEEEEINRLKYKMVRKIVKELNKKKKRIHPKN